MNSVDFQVSSSYAIHLDENDQLKHFRDQFFFPEKNGKPVLYFSGNSLGLQPRSVRSHLENELDQWKDFGVEGHFKGELPWMYYHKFFSEMAAKIVGALPSEVVVMNTLTTNLHLMMVSFYRPKGNRTKILMEGGAFPSDQYAMESQVRLHGLDPDKEIVELTPRPGEHTLRTEDILSTINEVGDELALIMIGGVNYYSGQLFDMGKITEAGKSVGAKVGYDLAHAAGNVELKLHDWGVDFAVWCSYKYLNSGPGGPGGVFVHDKHANKPELLRFAGWWGHKEDERFQMKKGFIPMEGAAGWQLSNAQIFSMAPHLASLKIFDEAGMNNLVAKSRKLTGYLEFLIHELNENGAALQIITPRSIEERGCQLSLLTDERGPGLYKFLQARGVLCDWREPNVIRFAPVPLYNSFKDVYDLYLLLKDYLGYES